MLKEIATQRFSLVINPTYSRTFSTDDTIVAVANAEKKVGSKGDLSNITKWEKFLSDKYYTDLIPIKDRTTFEFYRNRDFFENLIKKPLTLKKPYIRLKTKVLNFNLPRNYTILFIGASTSSKKWNIKKFVEIGSFLKRTYGYNIVVCGGPDDKKDAKIFRKLADYSYLDLTGKISLLDFLHVVCKGELMVSNETCAPHIAVALEMKNIFVISNGNHLGRFTPYPKAIWPYHYPIYHPTIESKLNNFEELIKNYKFESNLDVNEIKIESVKQKISAILSNKKFN